MDLIGVTRMHQEHGKHCRRQSSGGSLKLEQQTLLDLDLFVERDVQFGYTDVDGEARQGELVKSVLGNE